jgi:hypothetical protein
MRVGDAAFVFAQGTRSWLLEPGDEAQQRGLAAAGRTEQRDKFPGLDGDADVAQHRQLGAVDVEGEADLLDVERGAGGGIGDDLGGGYHLTVPFCQTKRRSRIENSSVIAPEQSSDITISAAYMLA